MTILKLVAKDFRVNRVYLITSLGILFLLSTVLAYGLLGERATAANGEWVIPENIKTFIYFFMVILSAKVVSMLCFMVDERSGVETLFASFPIKRSQLVLARYIGSIWQVIVSFALHLLAVLPAAILRGGLDHQGLSFVYNPGIWFVSFILLLLSNNFSLPVYFKLGLLRGVLVMAIIQLLLAAIVLAIMINLVDTELLSDYVRDVLKWVSQQRNVTLVIGSILGTLLVTIGSIMLSVRLYNTKDL